MHSVGKNAFCMNPNCIPALHHKGSWQSWHSLVGWYNDDEVDYQESTGMYLAIALASITVHYATAM